MLDRVLQVCKRHKKIGKIFLQLETVMAEILLIQWIGPTP